MALGARDSVLLQRNAYSPLTLFPISSAGGSSLVTIYCISDVTWLLSCCSTGIGIQDFGKSAATLATVNNVGFFLLLTQNLFFFLIACMKLWQRNMLSYKWGRISDNSHFLTVDEDCMVQWQIFWKRKNEDHMGQLMGISAKSIGFTSNRLTQLFGQPGNKWSSILLPIHE